MPDKLDEKFKRVPVLIPWDIYNKLPELAKKKTGREKVSPFILQLITQAIEEDERNSK